MSNKKAEFEIFKDINDFINNKIAPVVEQIINYGKFDYYKIYNDDNNVYFYFLPDNDACFHFYNEYNVSVDYVIPFSTIINTMDNEENIEKIFIEWNNERLKER
jgi:hypothetical protein